MKHYFIVLLLLLCSCKNQSNRFLNVQNDIDYIGLNQCASCHSSQYESFTQTGMGKSFRPALKQYSSAIFNEKLYDDSTFFWYNPIWEDDSLYIEEYSLNNGDTMHYLKAHVDYIIGSGHHTNSHLISNNGYLYQAPFTYYVQDSILDFPPGFEDNQNTRFSRKMGLECVACHNAFPDFVLGSENKYQYLPNGIDCERCHGPGQLHVENISKGNIIDTSKHIDYSIVNPKHLSIELQNDICARCHLQGNSVLQPDKSFFDFKPGMYLSEVMDVYLPRFSGGENDFIMASHFDRMKLSECYISSNEAMSCVNCHNPHHSVKNMPPDYFNNKCLDCHSNMSCSEDETKKKDLGNDCVLCHMPNSKTIDIPHVTITDHKIGIFKENNNLEKNESKDFLGLACVNNESPSNESIIQAYLQQYERFEPREYYLDSALLYLNKIDSLSHVGVYVSFYYFFLRNDFDNIIQKVMRIGVDNLLNKYLFKKEFSNKDAWTSYRIGEAFVHKNDFTNSIYFYQKAIELAPYNLEFRNKYGVALFHQNKLQFAIDEFKFIINEDSKYISAYANLGYCYDLLNNHNDALMYYNYALELNPYHEKTLLNKARLLWLDNKKKDAFICIDKLRQINPNNPDLINLMNIINAI